MRGIAAHSATAARLRAGQHRLAATFPGRVLRQLSELRTMNSSLQFSVLFTLGFIPFLLALSAALGRDFSRAVVSRAGFTGRAAGEVAALFAHHRAALAGLSVLSLILAVAGGFAVAHMVQTWYAKIFRTEIRRWPAMARRAEWLGGVVGYVALQVVISRRIQPSGGHVAAAGAQFVLAVVFWWWSLHCLLSGKVAWRQLFAAGLATAVCYTGLGFYLSYVASSSVVASEASYGPIGAVMTLIAAEIGLGVALQVGAVAGAAIGRGRMPGTGPGDVISRGVRPRAEQTGFLRRRALGDLGQASARTRRVRTVRRRAPRHCGPAGSRESV